MASVDLPTIQKLAGLYAQLGQKLVALGNTLTTYESAFDALQSALDDVNAILTQLGLPPISIPTPVDATLVQEVTDATARLNQSTQQLKDATPTS